MPDFVENERNLRRDYWAAKFPSKIGSLDGPLTWDRIYSCTQESSHQPPIQYRISFIKAIVKKLESSGSPEETTIKWYDCLETLSACPIQTEPFYRLYELKQEVKGESHDQQIPIKIYEDEKAFVSDGSTGFITWQASLELAKWLTTGGDTQSQPVTNDNCWTFELGCGTGLLAVSVMKTFSQLKHYRATDIHQGVLDRCQKNVAANKVDGTIDMTQLDWIQDEQKFTMYFQNAIQQYAGPGILLGADIIFDVSVVESLRKIIQSFLALTSTGRVFLSTTIRNEETIESFQQEIQKNSLQIKVVHSWECGIIMEITNSSTCAT